MTHQPPLLSLRPPPARTPAAMAEVVNVAVAFLVIVFIFRWATTPGEQSEADKALGFRPKKATQPMVDTVAAMFPDIPACVCHGIDIIVSNLSTGTISATTFSAQAPSRLPQIAYSSVDSSTRRHLVTLHSTLERQTRPHRNQDNLRRYREPRSLDRPHRNRRSSPSSTSRHA